MDTENKYCPYCNKEIKAEAILCKYCKSELEPVKAESPIWFVYKNDQEYEEYTWEQLNKRAQVGLLKQDDLLWSNGLAEWVPAGQYTELFPISKPLPQPAISKTDNKSNKRNLKIASVTLAALALLMIGFLIYSFYNNSILNLSDNISDAEVDDESWYFDDGDPDWWKKQPDYHVEEAAINETITELCQAFDRKDIEQALEFFSPEIRSTYQDMYLQAPEIMPQIAESLKNARINYLSGSGIDDARIAEYYVEVDGFIFYITFTKSDNLWLIQAL